MYASPVPQILFFGHRVLFATLLTSLAGSATADRLFVSSFATGDIHEVDLALGAVRPFASGAFRPESGACTPSSGHVYFAETLQRRITRWSLTSRLPENIVPAAGAIDSPIGPSFDPDGNLYVNTAGNPSPATGAWFLEGGSSTATVTQIVPPFGIYGGGSNIVLGGPHAGALLLVEQVARRIVLSEPPGAPARELVPPSEFPFFTSPCGIVTDGCGDIFVIVRLGDGPSAIQHYDPEGRRLPDLLTLSSSPITFGQYIDIDSVGNLYAASINTETIWKVTPDGIASPLAVVPGAWGVAICRDTFVPPCPRDPPVCELAASLTLPCPADLSGPGIQLDGSGSHAVDGGPLTFSWLTDCPFGEFDDETAAQPRLVVPDAPCDLACTVTLEIASASGLTSSCEMSITVQDSLAPVLATPLDLTVECPAPSTGPGSEAEWLALASATDECGAARVEHALVSTDAGCGGSSVRVHEFWAIDACGNESIHEQGIYQIGDTTPPEFSQTGHQFEISLWPPNHRYVTFDVSDVARATDACGSVTVSVTGCASSQLEDARDRRSRDEANGDGHTTQDCLLSLDGTRFAVRAERLGSCGTGSSRTYTIELTARDECGNSAASEGIVTIDHDGRAHGIDRRGASLRPNEPPPFPAWHPTTYARGCR